MDEIKREYTSDEKEELQARGTGLKLVPAGTSPVIDPELRDLLPPITDEEREALTADILKNGCYSPIICMEDMTLVDGHHRYDICTEHDIPYRMVILDFEDKLDAMEWMVNTQKGRRNLTTYQLGQIALKLKPAFEARAKEKLAEYHGNQYESGPLANSPKVQSDAVNTRKELADSVGIGDQTMGRIMQIDKSAPYPIKEALEKNAISVNKAYGMTQKLKDTPEADREDAARELLRQDEQKKYRQIDEEAAIAKAINNAIHAADRMEPTLENVRLWIDLCCIEPEELPHEAELAAEAVAKFTLLHQTVSNIIQEMEVNEDGTDT